MLTPYSNDMLDLLKTFNKHKVEYLIIGGRAVNVYAEPRGTKDLDVWVNPTTENAKRVYAALQDFGAPLAGVTAKTFEDKDNFFIIGVKPNRIDILKSIPGVELFQEAWKRKRTFPIHDTHATYIGPEDLHSAKIAAGRHIDLADAQKLSVAIELEQKRNVAQKNEPPKDPVTQVVEKLKAEQSIHRKAQREDQQTRPTRDRKIKR